MAGKKKRTDADPIEADDVQTDTPIVEVTAVTEPESAEPIKVKRPARKARIEIGTTVPDEETMPESVPILPLRNAVLTPMTGLPLEASQPRSLRLIDAVVNGDRRVVFVAQKDKELEGAGPKDLYAIGTLGVIQQMLRMPDGNVRLGVQGMERVRIGEYTQEEPYLLAKIERIPEQVVESLEIKAYMQNTVKLFSQLVELVPYLNDDLVTVAVNLDDPRQLLYLVAGTLRMDVEQKQELLEIDDIAAKFRWLNSFISKELEVLELGKKLQEQVQDEVGKSQREYFLREQMKAIQKELGEANDQEAEIAMIREKIEASGMPADARKEADRELDRLAKLPPQAAEYGIIKTYLDWMTSLPWNISTEEPIDIARARKQLNDDHYDLEKVKQRILEYLAVRKLKQDRAVEGEKLPNRDPILLFVGPPGVGKTSLGQSIATALGRKFTRMALGGMRDEAEIRGHRRTYIGAMPGRILQSIRRAGANDPVFILDEVDKIGADWRGDPSSALLEVLDPEQNSTFRDHYLDVEFDLSKVLFIATANVLDTIPAPLRDRMEIIELAGYSEEDKVHIAKRHLLPKQIEANGLRPDEMALTDTALGTIIAGYTREAGVRNLERELGAVARKVATEVAGGSKRGAKKVIGPTQVRRYLGRPRFQREEIRERTKIPGVATGLAVTAVGGDILFFEATRMPGKGSLTVTGQLGDVMKESVQAAMSYVRARAAALGIDPKVFAESDIHVHVPAGSVPKDGPSAGITLATAITSLLTGVPVRDDLAMTGEITLRGQVLPIGGVKDKVLAARRAGLTTVILPKRNEGDLDDLPKDVRKAMHFVLAEHIDQVLQAALEKPLPDGALKADILDTIEAPIAARQQEIAVVA
ncbi:MAG: endopeptidase La [Thermomicrobiales bacterium]